MSFEAARCAWEVVAGILPGEPQTEHSKRWVLTSEEWNGPAGLQKFIELGQAARTWALFLELESSQGRRVNWVRLEFIWY